MSFSPPLLADRYQLLEEIGRGGHAAVHRARDQRLGRDVAVKLLRDEAPSDNVLARFEREIRLTATLEHPHILHVHDTGVHEGRPFLVMELASGGTLADRLARESPLPILDALQVTRDVGLALAHAHAHGVVHRDVKPANILLRDGIALLADFGVAFAEPEALQRRLTSAGLAVGTAQYMSPEQLCADPGVDARSDQYSLALVLYELLAGVPAQTARTLEGLRLQRLAAPPLGVRTHRPSVPEAIEQALTTALAPVPADRFRDVPAFLAALGISASGEFRVPGTGGYAAVGASSGAMGRRVGDREASGAGVKHAPARLTPAGGSEDQGAVAGGANPGARGMNRRLPMLGAASVLLAAAAWAIGGRALSEGATLTGDRSGVQVILAEVADGNSAPPTVEKRVSEALAAELGAWRDVQLLPARARGEDAWRIAPSVGRIGDSVSVVLDVQRGRDGADRVMALGRLASDEDARALAATIARRLLAEVPAEDAPGLEALPERSLPALRAYVAGHRHLQRGALDSAEAAFRGALAEVRPFAPASFWAAQVASWRRPRDRASWATDADIAWRAVTSAGGAVDSLLASGLRALAQADYPGACDAYRAATTRDPGSFVAWYGLGDCQRLDSVVVARGNTRVFRGSIWSALQAYRRAIGAAPSPALMAALYPGLFRSTYADGGRTRMGWSDSPSGVEYRALASLEGDTLMFRPESVSDVERGAGRTVPSTYTAALRRARAVAIDLSRTWVERHPKAAEAWLAHATSLELAGRLGRRATRLESVDSALAIATGSASPGSRLFAELAIVRVRIALRRGLVDSALAAARAALAGVAPTADARMRLAPLAAFVGDSALLLSAPARPVDRLPSPVQEAITTFHRHALLDACTDLMAARPGLEQTLRSAVPDEEFERARERSLHQVYRDAAPCLGVSVLSELPAMIDFDEAARSLAAGRKADALAHLAQVESSRRGVSSGSISWDFQFLEAWARVEAGDSAGAARRLEAAFGDLATMSGLTLDYEAQAAGLRRAAVLLCALYGAGVARATDVGAPAMALTRFCNPRGGVP